MAGVGVFDHPANADLLKLLEGEAEPTLSHDLDGYELHALPEVCERLLALAGELDELPKGWYAAFGVPVLATGEGVIYAFAIGAGGIGLRLADDQLHHHLNRHEFDLVGYTVIDAWQTQLPGRIAADRLRDALRAAHAMAAGASAG
jgi:hypothetical protein